MPPRATFSVVRTETSPPTAVLVDGVSKTFRLPTERVSTLKERMLHPLRRPSYRRFDALKDISFEVPKGEFFGIVGRNGSGKSTLLKCMAGIYRVGSGAIYLDGRVSTFIELGVGFNPDLAAMDNVVLNGVMLGLPASEARERYERVVDFAELREFEDLKLKNYSSGMLVRLAFSVMVQVEADILLIDEVLAVGDAAFQQKCFDVFNDLRDQGRTIVLVTHDMSAVRRFCHRAMLIDRGEIVAMGDPTDVSNEYVDLNFAHAQLAEGGSEEAGTPSPNAGVAELLEVWWEDAEGRRDVSFHQGQTVTFRARVKTHRAIDDPLIAVTFENDQHQPLLVTSTNWMTQGTGSFAAGDELTFSATYDLNFAPGRIHASPWIARNGVEILDRRPQMDSLLVLGAVATGGLLELPHEVTLQSRETLLTAQAGA